MGTKLDIGAIAFGFEEQAAENAYPAGLNGIGATWDGDPDNTDQGLLLGTAEIGLKGSGLDLAIASIREQKPFVGTDFTRSLGDLLRAEIETISVAFPFCGNRATNDGTPADADFVPILAINAILASFGLNGAASGTPGDIFKFDNSAVFPAAGLIYFWGNRLELLDCRGETLSIVFEHGQVPKATASFKVATLNDPTSDGITPASPLVPVLDYGVQLSVSAPRVEGVGHNWGVARGFQTLTLEISQNVQEIGDSNIDISARVFEAEDRATTVNAEIFVDSVGDGEVYEMNQILADVVGDLDSLSFQVGDDTIASVPAKAVKVTCPQPALTNFKPIQLGTKAGVEVDLLLGHSTDKEELAIEFR